MLQKKYFFKNYIYNRILVISSINFEFEQLLSLEYSGKLESFTEKLEQKLDAQYPLTTMEEPIVVEQPVILTESVETDNPGVNEELAAQIKLRNEWLDQMAKRQAKRLLILEKFTNYLNDKYTKLRKLSLLARMLRYNVDTLKLQDWVQRMLIRINDSPRIFKPLNSKLLLSLFNKVDLVHGGVTLLRFINIFFTHNRVIFSKNITNKKIKRRNEIYKYKRRGLRKRRVFWRLTKVLKAKLKIFRRVRINFLAHSLRYITHKSSNNSLFRKTLLTRRLIEDSQLEFFYKNSKPLNPTGKVLSLNSNTFLPYYVSEEEDNKFRIYHRNYAQKPYWKLRTSRICHWNFFFQKTLRRQRYRVFLARFIKYYHRFKLGSLLFIAYLMKLNVSWSRILSIKTFFKHKFICMEKDIFFLPTLYSKNMNWKVWKLKNYRLRKKIGKWSYLKYKRHIFPWLQRRKNFPKRIKHLVPRLSSLKKNFFFDRMTNYVFTHDHNFDYKLPSTESFKVNFLTKLHMYRYNANNLCLYIFLIKY